MEPQPRGTARLVHGLRLLALLLALDVALCLWLLARGPVGSIAGFGLFYSVCALIYLGLALGALLLAPRLRDGHPRAAELGIALCVVLAVVGVLSAQIWLLPLVLPLLAGSAPALTLSLLFLPPLPAGLILGRHLAGQINKEKREH